MSQMIGSSSIRPVGSRERIGFVDALRGLALLCILIENMSAYSGKPYTWSAASGPIERLAVVVVVFLLEAKSYSLLSFLFGWGVEVQRTRIGARGQRALPVAIRRLVVLLGLGVLHGTLVWFGDVLTLYALLGVLLLLVRKRSARSLLVAAGLALLFTVLLRVPGEAMDGLRGAYESATRFLRWDALPQSVYATGTFSQITRRRVQDYLAQFSWLIYYAGSVLAMFLLGMAVGKLHILRDVERHLRLVRMAMWASLGIGVISNALYAWTSGRLARTGSPWLQFARIGSRTVGAPALVIFCVAGAALLSRRDTWQRRLIPLAQVGRMSLSNYLFQSVVCTLIFYGYGVRLYGRVGMIPGVAVSVLLYLLQVRLSGLWLDRHQFGPLEWVWRTLTYVRRIPMRIGATYDRHVSPVWGELQRRVNRSRRTVILLSVAAVLLCAAGAVAWRLRMMVPSEELPTAPGGESLSVDPATAPVPEAFVVATPVVSAVSYDPGPAATSGDLEALVSAVHVEGMLSEIAALTGPPFLGRYPGSPSGLAAGNYIADRFAQYGLQPAGMSSSFFQEFPIEYVALSDTPVLRITGPHGPTREQYVAYRDYSPVLRWYSGKGHVRGPAVWVNACSEDDFAAVDAVGKVVVCSSASAQRAQRYAMEHGAVALLLAEDPERRPADFGGTYGDAWVPAPLPTLRVFPGVMQDLLAGSEITLQDLTLAFRPLSLETVVEIQIAAAGSEVCGEQGCRARNVLGVLPGRDPRYASEVVIVGAHYDHLGQAPDGTAWVGANDDASGVATLVELARAWHEQGYVPRRTVLFAAWDAEEMGLLGSIFYVEHPQYPLEDTVAMIQLDMVGAGGDTLWVDGQSRQSRSIAAVAQAVGLEVENTNLGRSDHVPFSLVGVPATLLIWSSEEDEVPQYHRPGDTYEAIEPAKLGAAARITGLSLLALTEGQPAISELLARRAGAVVAGDESAFLDTSLAELGAADRLWFADVQRFSPVGFEMEVEDLRVYGRWATGTVRSSLHHTDQKTDDVRVKLDTADVRFVHTEDGWKWGGPDLVWLEEEDGFAVACPPGREKALEGVGRLVAEKYDTVAARLGLPNHAEGKVMFFASQESLRAHTALSLPGDQDSFVDFRVVKMNYSPHITQSVRLDDAVTRLVMAEAGVNDEAAPWLWQGLPLVLRDALDAGSSLTTLGSALSDGDSARHELLAWAATEFLRQRVGSTGLGDFVRSLGAECRSGGCEDGSGADAALAQAVGMDSTVFERAWRTHWQGQIAAIQAGVDAVLAERIGAVLSGDRERFLSTVDPDVPGLWIEQAHWFDELLRNPAAEFTLTARPLTTLDDQSVVAEVTTSYRLSNRVRSWDEGTVRATVRFARDGDAYRWSGTPFEVLSGMRLDVLYPAGAEQAARAVWIEAERMYGQLAAELDVASPDRVTIKLYNDGDAFRSSVFPSFPDVKWVPAWTSPHGSIKLRMGGGSSDDYRTALATRLAQQLLYQTGVDSRWFAGVMVSYLGRSLDGGIAERKAMADLDELLDAVEDGDLPRLGAAPPDYLLSEEKFRIASSQQHNILQYLPSTYSSEDTGTRELLRGLHRSLVAGQDLDGAFLTTIGQSLSDFECAWRESLARGHALPEWIDVAGSFDPDRAYEHVAHLALPQFAGRQAGSPEADSAAQYIAARFAEYGLVPPTASATESPDVRLDGYMQQFPISYTTWLAAPRLDLLDVQGELAFQFEYREEFVPVALSTGSRGIRTGEVVWVRVGDYGGMDLSDKIVLRVPSRPAQDEMALAAEHGAIGLVLVGNSATSKTLVGKEPLPISEGLGGDIPTLQIGRNEFSRLLESAGLEEDALLDSPPALSLGVTARIDIPLTAPVTVHTANVLGLLPGSDPDSRGRVMVLGAHYDHVGDDPDRWLCQPGTPYGPDGRPLGCEHVAGNRYPGANDDASGVGVLLEIARLWNEAGYQPRHSVLFAAWAAQEPGQVGSSYYVAHPLTSLEDTLGMYQLDAVGGGDGYYLEGRGDPEEEGLLRFSLQAAEPWVDGRLVLAKTQAGNDHTPFSQSGMPAMLLTWREASEDNLPADLADQVQAYRLGVTGRMVSLAAMMLAR